jgi:hypothetical protein
MLTCGRYKGLSYVDVFHSFPDYAQWAVDRNVTGPLAQFRQYVVRMRTRLEQEIVPNWQFPTRHHGPFPLDSAVVSWQCPPPPPSPLSLSCLRTPSSTHTVRPFRPQARHPSPPPTNDLTQDQVCLPLEHTYRSRSQSPPLCEPSPTLVSPPAVEVSPRLHCVQTSTASASPLTWELSPSLLPSFDEEPVPIPVPLSV